MKRGRILDAFVIETLGLLLVLWMLGATFFFKQIPHPNEASLADASIAAESSQQSSHSDDSSSIKSFLGSELSEAERRDFTDKQLTLFGNAAKKFLAKVGKDAVKQAIQQVTANQPIEGQQPPVSRQSMGTSGEVTKQIQNWIPQALSQQFRSTPQRPTTQQPTLWQSGRANAMQQPRQPAVQHPHYQRPIRQRYYKPPAPESYQAPMPQRPTHQQPVYRQPVGSQPAYREIQIPVYREPVDFQPVELQPVDTVSTTYYR